MNQQELSKLNEIENKINQLENLTGYIYLESLRVARFLEEEGIFPNFNNVMDDIKKVGQIIEDLKMTKMDKLSMLLESILKEMLRETFLEEEELEKNGEPFQKNLLQAVKLFREIKNEKR